MKDYALTPEEIVNSIDLDKERMYFDGKGSYVSTFDLTNLLKEQVAKVLKMMSEDIHAPCESFKSGMREGRKGILLWGLEPCTEHIKYNGNPADFDYMQGVLSKRECPKCWQSLQE